MLTFEERKRNNELSELRKPIYRKLYEYLPYLSKEQLEKVREKRGIITDTLSEYCRAIPFSRADLNKLFSDLKEYFPEHLVHAAGFTKVLYNKDYPELGAVYNCLERNLGNICFGYHDTEGDVYYIRPHKDHAKGQSLTPFRVDGRCDSVTILTEGEYKALASKQLTGCYTVSLSGLQSFSGANYGKLCKALDPKSEIILILDYEHKPKWVESDAETGPIHTLKLALKLEESGYRVRIGILPRKYASESTEGWKVDIDGALAKGMTAEEYAEVIAKAVKPIDYVDAVCPEIQVEIKKFLPSVSNLKMMERVYAGNK
ncbi:MAG: hypothetical protein JNL74_11275 [Fibrobacteres bacterium]|nr:hypothetical protein [Fibrobacterota bacterium]